MMDHPPIRMDLGPCPHCGLHMDANIPLNTDDRPEPGAVIVCIRCRRPFVIFAHADGLRLRLPTEAEEQILARHASVGMALIQDRIDSVWDSEIAERLNVPLIVARNLRERSELAARLDRRRAAKGKGDL